MQLEVGGSWSTEGLGIGVVDTVEAFLEAVDQIGHDTEDSAAQILVGQVAKYRPT